MSPMTNPTMQGLAEFLRKQDVPGHSGPYYENLRRWASEVEAAQAALSAAEPVAVRYRDGGKRWRYINFPFTKGWEFPPNLGTPENLFTHPTPKEGEALDVLRELVSIKDTYARLHRLHEMGHGTDYDQTRKAEAAAWDRARALTQPTKDAE
jgi:hypothetical protein